MSPDCIAWARKHAAIWSARAAELRAIGGKLNVNLALGLEWTVAGMLAGLPTTATAATPTVDTAKADAIEGHLAAATPRVDPATGVTFNAGPILTAVREDLRTRLADLRGEARPIVPPTPAPPMTRPPAEPVPFTAGPQLDLFGLAA